MGSTSSVLGPHADTRGALVSRQRPTGRAITVGTPHPRLLTFFVASDDGSVTAVRKLNRHVGFSFAAHARSHVVGIGFVYCGASKTSIVPGRDHVATDSSDASLDQPSWCGAPALAPSECDDVVVTAGNDGFVRVWQSDGGACVAEVAPFAGADGDRTHPPQQHAPRVRRLATADGIVSMAWHSPERKPTATSVHDDRFVAYAGYFALLAVDGRVAALRVSVSQGRVTVDTLLPGCAGSDVAPRRIRASWLEEAAQTDLAVRALVVSSCLAVRAPPDEVVADTVALDAVFAAGDGVAVAPLRFLANGSGHSNSEPRHIPVPQCRNGLLSVCAAPPHVEGRPHGVVFAAGFNAVVAVCLATDAVLWSARSGHDALVLSIAVSADGSRLVTGCAEGAVVLRSAASGAIIDRAPRLHPASIGALHFVADDRAACALGGGSSTLAFLKLPAHPRHRLAHGVVPPEVLPADVVTCCVAPFLVRTEPTVE